MMQESGRRSGEAVWSRGQQHGLWTLTVLAGTLKLCGGIGQTTDFPDSVFSSVK